MAEVVQSRTITLTLTPTPTPNPDPTPTPDPAPTPNPKPTQVQMRMTPGDIVLAHQKLAHRISFNHSPFIRYQVQ